jgi:hypothetical protein
MSGPTITDTGEVISSALNASHGMSAEHHIYNAYELVRGQIEQVYAVDDSDNNLDGKGVVTLFDVRVWLPDGGTELIRRCRVCQPISGGSLNNFFEVLPPDPGVESKNYKVESSNKRGTHVLVGFISGQKTSGVILGALPHPNAVAVARRPKKALGTHLEGEFQGFNYKIQNDGSVVMTFNGPRDDKGKLIGSAGPTVFTIDAQGRIKLTTNANQEVLVDRVAKTVQIVNGTTSWKMEQTGSKITAESDHFVVKARQDVKVEAGGKATVKAKGEAIVASDTMIKLQKGDGAPDEPFVLGKKFVKFMGDFLKAIMTHNHIGNLGIPTAPPLNVADFASLMSSPIQDESILSKHIIGTK